MSNGGQASSLACPRLFAYRNVLSVALSPCAQSGAAALMEAVSAGQTAPSTANALALLEDGHPYRHTGELSMSAL